MRARRKDASHAEVVATFKAMGCSWVNLESSTKGVPDGILGISGRTELVEVKPESRKTAQNSLRASQMAWGATWTGSAVHVVHNVTEAAALVNNLRTKSFITKVNQKTKTITVEQAKQDPVMNNVWRLF